MIVPLRETRDIAPERFTVRWTGGHGPTLGPGYAVFDGTRRVTITFPTFAEAEQHRNSITQIYARYGW